MDAFLSTSDQAAEMEGVQVKGAARRFNYLKKHELKKFYLRLIPVTESTKEYEPKTLAYHRHLAQLKLAGGTYDVSSSCLGIDCSGCRSSDEQRKAVKYEDRGRDWYKIAKERSVGRFFIGYPAYLNEDGSFTIMKDEEPKLIEYRYNRNNKCEDWDDLAGALKKATSELGVTIGQILDPVDGLIIKVEQQEKKAPGGRMNRTAYIHTVLNKKVPLPENWESEVVGRVPLSKLYLKFDNTELSVVIDNDEAIRSIESDKKKQPEQKLKEIADLMLIYKEVPNEDFQRIIEYYETAKEEGGGHQSGFGGIGEELSAKSAYSQASGSSLDEAKVAPQSGEATPDAPEQKEQSTRATSAAERLSKLRQSRGQ